LNLEIYQNLHKELSRIPAQRFWLNSKRSQQKHKIKRVAETTEGFRYAAIRL